MFDVGGIQKLVSSESIKATRGSDDNVGAASLVLEQFCVLGDGRAAVENGSANVGHVLGKPAVLVLDLVRELARMAENDHGHFPVYRFELLEGRENEHSSFSMPRLGLTQHVHPQDGLGDTFLLH